MFATITIRDKEYKGRLTARSLVELEKKLGTSPINIFMEMSRKEGYFPELEMLITIFHASLQPLEHNVTLDKAYELYDAMVDEGKTMIDLLNFIVEVFQVSGLIPKEATGNTEAKN